MTRPAVTQVVLGRDGYASWHAAIAAAAGRGGEWLWLVDRGVEPAPGALEALLAVAADPGDLPPPVLLASKVLGPDGRLDRAGAPWPPYYRTTVIAAAARGLASVRLARWGSLLVRVEAVAAHGPPRADFAGGADDLEWTARLLRDAPGYFVPASTAIRRSRRVGRLREGRDRLRMLHGPRWAPHEALWFAYESAFGLGSGRTPSRSPRATVRRLSALPRFTRR